MDLTEYRASLSEQKRTADLLRLMPKKGGRALDIGARDGHFSLLMAERFDEVVALDLVQPDISHPNVECVKGDASTLEFPDASFDLVFCAEVLEHIPVPILQAVCREIERVSRSRILIGVPYKQDIRVGRTTCYACGKPNPPWGHVNSFNEARIAELFPRCKVEQVSTIGRSKSKTNWISTALLDFAGNPYGTYDQEESCTHCGKQLAKPPRRRPSQLVATKLGFWARWVTQRFAKSHGNWIHVQLTKTED